VKGIAHFVSGVAVATCFPEIVHNASQSLAFGPALGGLAGLLPDTLDFKVTRYFRRVDDEIDPAEIVDGLGNPDPQSIADRIARAMNRAYMSDETVQISPARNQGGRRFRRTSFRPMTPRPRSTSLTVLRWPSSESMMPCKSLSCPGTAHGAIHY